MVELPVSLAYVSVDGGGRVHQDDLILASLLARCHCFGPLFSFVDGALEPVVKPPVKGLPVREAGRNLELVPTPGKGHPQKVEHVDRELDILPGSE
jgi:hypothetical protein